MELPTGLTLEAAAWVDARIAIANARTAATIRTDIDKVDDWCDGMFVALRDVLQQLLTYCPGLADDLAPSWRAVAELYDQVNALGLRAADDQPIEFLQARKMLYRMLVAQGVMRDQGAAVPKPRGR